MEKADAAVNLWRKIPLFLWELLNSLLHCNL